MATTVRMPEVKSDAKLSQIQRLLDAKRLELTSRLSEHREDVLVEREPDDEGAEANGNYSREFALTTIERERRNLAEIEAALGRIKKGEYGICSACGNKIPDARLRAIPWATICVPCAEKSDKR